MFYIPADWLKNKGNEEKVHEILNKYFPSDLGIDVASPIKELQDMGETIIIEKINDGTISLN